LVTVVKARLRVYPEGRDLRGAVPRIGADDSKVLQQGARQRAPSANVTGGGDDGTIESAVPLVKEPTVPIHRQAHFETDGVGLSIDRANPFEHRACELTMGGNIPTGLFQRAGSNRGSGGEDGIGVLKRRHQLVTRQRQWATTGHLDIGTQR
jgi:hypothetical protein